MDSAAESAAESAADSTTLLAVLSAELLASDAAESELEQPARAPIRDMTAAAARTLFIFTEKFLLNQFEGHYMQNSHCLATLMLERIVLI